MGLWKSINMFGFLLCLVALVSSARCVTRVSQPLVRFSYMDGHFHATRYLDGDVHATGRDVTGRHVEDDAWVLVVYALRANTPWPSSSTSWPASSHHESNAGWPGEMQKGNWLGEVDTLAADLHLVGCCAEMAAE